MLFDLRSRGRRTTVKFIYSGLALVMLVGLIGLGVGTGTGNGGFLNLDSNGGGGGNSNSAFTKQTKEAIKAVNKSPNSASAWSSLVLARYSEASSGSNYNSTTGAFSAGGIKQLKLGAQAWQHYIKVAGKPDFTTATLAARIYQNLGQWLNESTAWEYAVQTQPTGSSNALKPYMCMALSSYAAGRTATGDLAAAQAIKLTPKIQRLTLQSSFKSAKSSKTTAEETLVQDC